MKPLVFVLVALVLLPAVLSFDCSSVSESSYCSEIQSSSLPESEKELVYASLLYGNIYEPDHNFVEEYNEGLSITSAPFNVSVVSSSLIRDAWLSFSYIAPSVYENGSFLVPQDVRAYSHYNYWLSIPLDYHAWRYPHHNSYGDCRTTHHVTENSAVVRYYVNNVEHTTAPWLFIFRDSEIKAELTISARVEQKHYWWQRHCRYCTPFCQYEYSTIWIDSIVLDEVKEVIHYDAEPEVSLEILNEYQDTTQGKITATNYSTYAIDFPTSNLTRQQYSYSVMFEKEPYHVAVLQAHETPVTTIDNLYIDNNTFYVNALNPCLVSAYNHFEDIEEECDITNSSGEIIAYETEEQDISLSLLWYVLTFCVVAYILYKLIQSQLRKIVLPIFLVLMILPAPVLADTCSITNFASCLPEVLFDFVLYLINLPIAPLLSLTESLLTADVSIALFESLWSIIRYIVSVSYIFFILYAGVILVIGNANPIKRAHAKGMLQGGIFMMILVQGSFYLYDLLTTLAANMSSALLSQVDPTFFLLTVDSLANIGLQFAFGMVYLGVLLINVLLLVIRYIIVSMGVVLFPIGIFLFFIPPLKSYGKFILTFLGIMIFVTFFDMLIILASSMLLDIPLFVNFKILVMIVCFILVGLTTLFSFIFSLSEATTAGLKDNLSAAVKYVGLLFV